MTRLNDRQMLQHALAYDDLRTRAKALKDQADTHLKPFMAEMKERKAEVFEFDGHRVTPACKRTTSYDPDTARKHWLASVYRRVRRTSIDNEAVKSEIAAGRLTAADAAAAASTSTSRPWLVVTKPKEAAA